MQRFPLAYQRLYLLRLDSCSYNKTYVRPYVPSITDHPLTLCAAGVVATVGVCTVATFQWIVPTMTASLTHSAELLKEGLKKRDDDKHGLERQINGLKNQITNLNKEVEDFRKVIALKDKSIAKLKTELFESQKANIFTAKSPYPMGLDKVKIGDPIEKIAEAYPFETNSNNNSWISVKLPSEVFTRIGFNHSYEVQGKVEAITFDLGRFRGMLQQEPPVIPDGWLEQMLTRSLGEPILIGVDDDCLVWLEDKKSNVMIFYKRGDTNYMVSTSLLPGGCFITDEQRKKSKDR